MYMWDVGGGSRRKLSVRAVRRERTMNFAIVTGQTLQPQRATRTPTHTHASTDPQIVLLANTQHTFTRTQTHTHKHTHHTSHITHMYTHTHTHTHTQTYTHHTHHTHVHTTHMYTNTHPITHPHANHRARTRAASTARANHERRGKHLPPWPQVLQRPFELGEEVLLLVRIAALSVP